MHDENMKPWDRQQGEGRRAYEAFCIFRDLGLGRKLTKVAEKLTKSKQIVTRWSSQFNWQGRADAYDAHLLEEEDKARAAQRKEELDQREEIAKMLQVKAAESIQNRELDKASFHALTEMIRLGAELSDAVWAERQKAKETQENGVPTITFTYSRENPHGD